MAIQTLWICASSECREPSSSWGTAVLGTRVVPQNAPELNVVFISEESGQLVGACTLANVPSGSYKPAKLVIQGQWRSGAFYPTIVSQVGDQYEGPWRAIRGRSRKLGTGLIVLQPGDSLTDLRISLEPFREYIGKYRVGRVVLLSGASDVFELQNLLPPPTPSSDSVADSKIPVDGIESQAGNHQPPRQPKDLVQTEASSADLNAGATNAVADKAYHRILESKLFLTRADCARLSVRSPSKPELALSVYSRRLYRSASRHSYYVTVTEASKNIYQSLQENKVVSVSVERQTAWIPAEAAVALKDLWKKLLAQANPTDAPPEVSLNGEAIEFSLDALPNPVSVDEIPVVGQQEAVALQRLRDLLEKYCTVERSERAALAKKIRRNAQGLSNKL